MTPIQKIKREILLLAEVEKITAENVDEQYDIFVDKELHWDFESEFRCGTVETKLPCYGSRHYESKSVATKLSDGSWVGWTYWYGGGKHGNPEEIDWMSDAYDLEVTERLIMKQEFKKI